MTRFRAAIRSLAAGLGRSSRGAVLAASVGLVVLIGWLDYVTTVELSFLTFYWVPVALATWYHSKPAGYGLAIASVALAVTTDISTGVAHSHPFFLLWDIAARLASFLIFVWMLAKIKELFEQARKVSQLEMELHASQAAYRELQAFSYIISHNLYAPLRSIQGHAQIVLEEYAGKLDPEAQQYLQRLSRSSQRMGSLIQAVLTLAEFSGGDLQVDEVDLSALVGDIVKDLESKDPGRAVQFTIEPGITAQGDSRLLRIGLQLLLENAWKFTGKRTQATIYFGTLPQDGEPVYFVRDNGVGFSMAYADKLFTPFQTVHPRGEFEGLGMGLAIVERIIRRHGGRIWAKGAEGKGATFFFTVAKQNS